MCGKTATGDAGRNHPVNVIDKTGGWVYRKV
jgi:hypothetical protein